MPAQQGKYILGKYRSVWISAVESLFWIDITLIKFDLHTQFCIAQHWFCLLCFALESLTVIANNAATNIAYVILFNVSA